MGNLFKKNGYLFLLAIAFFLLNSSCTHMNTKSSNQQLIKDYYASYEKKDWNLLESILADSFTFTSPAGDDRINIKTYKERCWPNALNTKKFDLELVLVDGDDGLVTYNGWTTAGKLFRNTERFKFKDGKILSNECFFGNGVNFPNNAQ
jgi:ketosteroid isomerase-like protein